MTALHVGVTARKGHIAHAVWKGKTFSQNKATPSSRHAAEHGWGASYASARVLVVQPTPKNCLKMLAVGARPICLVELAGSLDFVLMSNGQQTEYTVIGGDAQCFADFVLGGLAAVGAQAHLHPC